MTLPDNWKADIQAEIAKFLADPTQYPAELKAWIPRWLEVNPAAIQLHDIQGLYSVASTVSGLGAAVHGRMGVIRAGTSPYDYLKVTYDATYGKWVSDPMHIFSWANGGSIIANSVDVNFTGSTYSGNYAVFPYRIWDTAGMKLQLRTFGRLWAAPATDCQVQYFSSNYDYGVGGGSSAAGPITITSVTGAVSAASDVWVDSGFQDVVWSSPVRDVGSLAFLLHSTNGTYDVHAAYITHTIRWVSK